MYISIIHAIGLLTIKTKCLTEKHIIMDNIQNNNYHDYAGKDIATASGYTLLGAMQRVVSASADSHLERAQYSFESQVDGELEYLTSRLGLPEEEAVLFSILCEKGAHQQVSLYDIGHYLGCDNLETLQVKSRITPLVEIGLIGEDSKGNLYVPEEVLMALSRNEPWLDDISEHASDGELYRDIYERFVLAAACRISKVALYKGVHRLLETNAHLRFAKAVERYRASLDEDELMFLLSLSSMWLVKGTQWAPFKNIASVLRNNVSATKVLARLLNGSSPLLSEGIIKPYMAESFINKQGFMLTTETRKQLKPETNVEDDPLECLMKWAEELDPAPQQSKEVSPRLLLPDKIVKHPLFYNEATALQVAELAALLNEKKMRSVQRRLKRSGLRCGFACIFHGGPGTGKTETVLQLARRTGRAVFQVEVSQLRAKWHGESEKLVKEVFDEYRKMVSESALAPIMLFNEADAIFSRRINNPEYSSDKCENAIQNIILQEMETLDGILIATTNLASNLDDAFERRFLYKVEFESPDAETRSKIWHSMMPTLGREKAQQLADMFPALAGGHIENIARKVTVSKVLHGGRVSWDNLTEMCRHELMDSRGPQVIGFRPMFSCV